MHLTYTFKPGSRLAYRGALIAGAPLVALWVLVATPFARIEIEDEEKARAEAEHEARRARLAEAMALALSGDHDLSPGQAACRAVRLADALIKELG